MSWWRTPIRQQYFHAQEKEYGQRSGQNLVIAEAANSNLQWLVADQLGTPRILADQTGNLSGIKRRDYLPFGEDLLAGIGHRATTNGYEALVGQAPRQQFVGDERDNETGLDFAQARSGSDERYANL